MHLKGERVLHRVFVLGGANLFASAKDFLGGEFNCTQFCSGGTGPYQLPVPQIEIDGFHNAKAWLARFYNQIRHWRVLHAELMMVGSFFQIVRVKRVSQK